MQPTIHSGSTLLNLSLTGTTAGGWPLGRVSNIVGDRSSGKTLLAIEAATLFIQNPPKGITPRVVYYEAEAAFDQEYARSLGMPVDDIEFIEGKTVENLYDIVEATCDSHKKGEGILFVLDSLDALTDDSDLAKKFGKQDYSRKAAKMTELFRKLARKMELANLHLMVISQVRENITTLPFAPKFTRSGGLALNFYCTHIVWLAEWGKLKASSTDWVYGINIECKVTKNKVSKPFRSIKFPIIFEYGVDDISSMLSFLKTEAIPTAQRISTATGGYFLYDEKKLRLDDMVTHIQEKPELYQDIVTRTKAAWDALEEKTGVVRRPKSEMMASQQDEK